MGKSSEREREWKEVWQPNINWLIKDKVKKSLEEIDLKDKEMRKRKVKIRNESNQYGKGKYHHQQKRLGRNNQKYKQGEIITKKLRP